MKPWVQNAGWFNDYARGVAAIKGIHVEDRERFEELCDATETAFRRVYRAVAFDIDGTLTRWKSPHVSKPMAQVVGRLLQRGVPVILISGRGRTYCRRAAEEVVQLADLSGSYMRRLYCVPNNGVYLLRTPSDSPWDFLADEMLLTPESSDAHLWYRELLHILSSKGVEESQFGSMWTTVDSHSIRLVFKFEEDRVTIERSIRSALQKLGIDGRPVYLYRGSFGNQYVLDLVGTNKRLALERVSAAIGESADRVLRIGDQGQEGGNDFDLLDSVFGFSVDQISNIPTRCHPVLADNLRSQLRGANATNHLIRLLLLFPSLSISPAMAGTQVVRSLRHFEEIATGRSRDETSAITARVRVRLRNLLPSSASPMLRDFGLGDIYDVLSGGIKFRDWELDHLPNDHPALKLFGIPELLNTVGLAFSSGTAMGWSMFTDNGVLLRGPFYYVSLIHERYVHSSSDYLELVERFLTNAGDVLVYLRGEEVDFSRYKMVLGILDNIRNILLQLLNVSLIGESEHSHREYPITKGIYSSVLTPHTQQHIDLLLNPEAEWSASLERYSRLLTKIIGAVRSCKDRLVALTGSNGSSQRLFKWRECDYFVQNLAAVQLGVHELRQLPGAKNVKRWAAVGLAAGGNELPAIAQAVAQLRGFELEPGLLTNVSHYGNEAIGDKIRAGEQDYVTELLYRTSSLCMMGGTHAARPDAPSIILDDNCTTCATLQLARDLLVMNGRDVVGAIVVRFPGMNRSMHMRMEGHGFPNPEVLLSFVRGLVAPSPYTRLIVENQGKNPYLNRAGKFDKSKDRIQQYLFENGVTLKGVE